VTGGTSRHGEETISKDFNAKRYLYVVDLDPVVVDEHPEVVERYNPGRSPSTPCVFVGYAVDPHPSIRFANGFDESRNSLTRRYGVDLRHDDDCTGNATSKRRILARVERCVTRLRGQGWTVLNEPPPRKHSVYVLELDPVAGETEKVRRANPLPRIPEDLDGPVLVTLTAGGNDLLGLLDIDLGRPAKVPDGQGEAAVDEVARTLERIVDELRAGIAQATILVGTVYDPRVEFHLAPGRPA